MKKTVLTVFFSIMFLFFFTTAFAEVRRFQVPLDDSPRLGPADAPVTIIEFLDFQ